jgi:hypothetical protein
MKGARRIDWKGRDGILLSNGVMRLVALNGGGHIAHLGFGSLRAKTSPNLLWEASWQTVDPDAAEWQSAGYGPPDVRRYLSGYTGHALCLDYFGAAPPGGLFSGLSLHGEAASSIWTATLGEGDRAGCAWTVSLPEAGLSFERNIDLMSGESVAFVSESVRNERDACHSFDWVQHVTFGEPLLERSCSRVLASAGKGVSSPDAYGADSRIALDEDVEWPYARCAQGDGFVDLREPFAEDGRGFIAGFQFDAKKEFAYVTVINWQMNLGIGYCFSTQRFPYMTVWEENRCRQEAPWNGRTRARGMEFGTTWLPRNAEGYRGRSIAGGVCPAPLAPRGSQKARYVMFLFTPPPAMRTISDIRVGADALVVSDSQSQHSLSIQAHGVERFLSM